MKKPLTLSSRKALHTEPVRVSGDSTITLGGHRSLVKNGTLAHHRGTLSPHSRISCNLHHQRPRHPGTGQAISDAGIPVNILPKLASGQRPNFIDLMKNKDMAMVINTPSGKNTREDEVKIRTATMQNRIPIMTTLRGADAALKAIKSLQRSEVQVRALQEYHI